jgi:uncharacterized protein (TIGR02588 family)
MTRSSKEEVMSVSRSTVEPAADRMKKAKQPSDNGGAKSQSQETPFWEQVAGFIGLLLVLGVLGLLIYEGIQPQTEAEIVTEVKSISPQPGGYLVAFEASNRGRSTAASVLVEGALYDAANPDEAIEAAEVTFDYIPDQSGRAASFVFEHDPRQYDLRIQVKGFTDP